MLQSKGYGTTSADDALHHLDFPLRAPGPHDVRVTYCNICHSNLYTMHHEWGTPFSR